jgi:acetylornithine deacetylase/succinyl-diaminopimelate desuccinylase-like protein
MLFVPCRDGVSHSPEEAADARDAALGVAVLAAAADALAAAAGALSTMRKDTPSAV